MRNDRIDAMMAIAFAMASMGTCPRRKVGAVITDKFNHIIGTGYNGSPRGAPHCYEDPCLGRNAPHGDGLELCNAIHAEQNALLQCKDVMAARAIYTTDFPCIHCFKMICNTGIKTVLYARSYPAFEEQVYEMRSKLKRKIDFVGVTAEPIYRDTRLASAAHKFTAGLVE